MESLRRAVLEYERDVPLLVGLHIAHEGRRYVVADVKEVVSKKRSFAWVHYKLRDEESGEEVTIRLRIKEIVEERKKLREGKV